MWRCRSVIVACTLLVGCRKPAPAPPEPTGRAAASAERGAVGHERADRAAEVPPSPASPRSEPDASSRAGPDAAPRAGTAPPSPPRAGESVTIGPGRFPIGSTPGDDGREPRLEPVQLELLLSAYEMDRLPYPNDPREPARTDVTLKDAVRLCSARGQRLCSEAEWEAACRGPEGARYASGEVWDAACSRTASSCASSSGALGLGASREWTASWVNASEGDPAAKAAVRGSSTAGDPTEHRCARRSAVAATSHARDLGFRCCRGPVNDAAIAAPKLGPSVRKSTIDPGQMSEIFASIPKLAAIAGPIRYFADPDDANAVLRRGTADLEGFTLTTAPLLWNPVPGDELLVAVGHGARDSFAVALYRLPDNRYKLASSLLFVNDLGPFVLAYHPEIRERLLWSSCWKCPGEGGAVSLRDGRRVVIVQQ